MRGRRARLYAAMTLQLWLTFCGANLLTSLSFGPGALASVDAGMAHGGKRALWLVAGLQCALLAQLSVVGLGAGALLRASDTLFALLRALGAFYLLWLGLKQWLWAARAVPFLSRRGGIFALPAANKTTADSAFPALSRGGLFRRGMLVNCSNPKAILFQAALVPHFIDTERALLPQYGVIALTMCAIDTLVMAVYAALAGRLARRCHARAACPPFWLSFCFGASFIAFGILLLGAKGGA